MNTMSDGITAHMTELNNRLSKVWWRWGSSTTLSKNWSKWRSPYTSAQSLTVAANRQELDGADRSCYNTGTGEIDYSASIDENDEDPSGGQSEYYTRIFERLAQMAFPTYHNDESIQEEYSWWDDGYDDQTYDEGHYYEDGVYEGENESEDVAYDGTYDAGYDYDDGTYDHGYGYYQE